MAGPQLVAKGSLEGQDVIVFDSMNQKVGFGMLKILQRECRDLEVAVLERAEDGGRGAVEEMFWEVASCA